MKIYLVGGAVRDKLLGLPIKERDWVVVGATVDQMLKLGFRQVGKEFPVFLHPDTNEEYALARMERKINPGYKGFTFDTSPDVSLEEDLLRRDLTINAIAESPEGQVIDPYHGKDDLTQKCLRHVSPSFLEDPVRILRVGRFAARFHYLGFSIAAETSELMRKMVALGEVDALVAERVWKELDRALAEKNPEQFFVVLAQCQALPKLFPTILIDGAGIKALSAATQLHFDSSIVRFSALLHDAPEPRKTIAEICARYRAPNAYRELATLTATHYKAALKAKTLNAQELLKLFNGLDIYRREPRFNDFLQATDAIAHALDLTFDAKWLKACALAAKAYPVHELLEQGLTGNELVTALKEKRCEAISLWLKNSAKT